MKDLISKADVLETYAELNDTFEDNQFIRKELNKVYDKLNGLPYAQLEPCEDAISRQRLLNDLEELIAAWEKYPVMAERIKGVETAIGYVKTIPSVAPKQEPCEDAVSRQAAINALENTECKLLPEEWNELTDAIMNVPSVTPKRKTGKWIHEIVNSYTEKTYCSECGKSAPFVYVSDDYYGVHAHGEVRKTDFCPHCGADMRGEQDD